jgi:ribonuclease HI
MPWVEALLRGQKVLAKARADGAFVEDDGRVEIRYKPNDGRAYRALARNLARTSESRVLPDDHCAPAEVAPPKTDASATSGAAATAPRAAGRATKAASKATSKGGPVDATPLAATDWVAYTDGACSGNPGPAGLGVIVLAPGGAAAHEGYEYLGIATNNVAELTAILRAVEATPAAAPRIVVHTDSQYAIGVLAKGWRAKANTELIETIRAAITARGRGGVKLVYVPGHAGVPLNERADELAREAIRARKSRPLQPFV